jgi:phosphoribosylformylglycinamidine synthase
MIRARVYITPKQDILDPQGKAIQEALMTLGFSDVAEVRVGKYMEIAIHSESADAAAQTVKNMCEKLLANTVIETYRYDIDTPS